HQGDVGGAEAAKAEIDEAAFPAAELRREREGRFGLADRGIQAMPGVVQRAPVRVVRRLGIDIQVEIALVDELQVRQPAGALLPYPVVELRPEDAVGAVILVAER